MIAHRVFAILSAVFLVTAVAVATLGSRSQSLELWLFQLDRGAVSTIKNWTLRLFGEWTWTWVVSPLMVRPAWLLPTALGLVSTGLALSLSYRHHARQSHWRS